MAFYTGIGSRETPEVVLNQMQNYAKALKANGFILRSGGAGGADSAFETNSLDDEIYLPWDDFNDKQSNLILSSMKNYKKAEKILKTVVDEHHWNSLSSGGKKLHTRNVYQILGQDLKTPSDFVIAWTKNGLLKGGTATALKLAALHDVKIYNLALIEDCKLLDEFIVSLPHQIEKQKLVSEIIF